MPVTAKLSRNFYDRFGDEIATELVDWFNQVDEDYRGQLRELNELNYARFEAKLEQRVAELRSDLRVEFRTALSDVKADLMRWMFGLWATQMLATAGLFLSFWLRP